MIRVTYWLCGIECCDLSSPEVEGSCLQVDITGRVSGETSGLEILVGKLWGSLLDAPSSLLEYLPWGSLLLENLLWISLLLEYLLWSSLLLECLSRLEWSCLEPIPRVDKNIPALQECCLWLCKNTAR